MLERLGLQVGIGPIITPKLLTTHATLHVLFYLSSSWLPALALVVYCVRRRSAVLTHALVGESIPAIVLVFLLSCLAVFLLDHFRLVPFSWRIPANTSLQYVTALKSSNQWLAISILAGSTMVTVPLVEETIFRFGLFQWMLLGGMDVIYVIITTAVVFGLAHSLTVFASGSYVFESAAYGIVLGTLTWLRGGRIAFAIAMHSGINAAEFFGVLLYS